ncbi:5-oxoprolinase subunit PxpB [Paenibacillus mesophilus]|uniref:5-oxoprolinase subunit PxpB n=1 Tax=Paenibacillus mesophilus TaxID=2582849 RepID=UPI00110DE7C9|nr:5-oxoprolinase subunit PxpB [Paenibacillus mesophilus]TMV50594.1 5-oxoprolinase subunit PxpB [Paenibacillus mesophilus]
MSGNGGETVFYPLGDCALLIRFGDRIEADTIRKVRSAARLLEAKPFPGFIEAVPSYGALAVHYDPWVVYRTLREKRDDSEEVLYEAVCDIVRSLLASEAYDEHDDTDDVVTIPVCYGGRYGPDLDELAAYHHIGAEEAVALHAGADYTVAMIGFAPGFPYLAGLPGLLATPRRATPRSAVPAGSVGIAGAQTGLYSLETPGGWNIIGRTPLPLFRPYAERPSLLRAGDRVRFEPITPERFEELSRGLPRK